MPSFFGRGLPTYLTSTPAVAAPALFSASGRSSGPGVHSLTHPSGSSSGISSVQTTSLDPTPTPLSFAPNYGHTPSVRFADEATTRQQTTDRSQLATLVAQSLTVSEKRISTAGSSSALRIGTSDVTRFSSIGKDTQNSKASNNAKFICITYCTFNYR